jgi:hypothetical protein
MAGDSTPIELTVPQDFATVFLAMTGLLIVHGMGEQRRGETTAKLIAGLRAAYGDSVSVSLDGDQYPNAVTANGRTVRLYEVHWADFLSATASKGTFSWDTINTLVWHPLWCHRFGLLPPTEYSAALVWWRVITLVPLAPVTYLSYVGARFFAQILDRSRREAFEARMRKENLPARERALAYASFTSDTPTMVDEMLDSVVADVPNYMRSIVEGNGCAFQILQCFHTQLACARNDGCDTIHVLAHSLGTVIAFHALSGVGQPAHEPAPAPARLFTIGSPLEKIRFFWPWTLRAGQPSAHPDFQWVNFHNRADRVSGSLERFAAFTRLRSVRLKGGGGLLRSHIVYERSPEFLTVMTEALFGAPAAPRLHWTVRLTDRLLTWGENLLAPFALVSSIVFGLAFVVLVVIGPAYLVSLPFRWTLGETAGVRIENGFALFTIVGMTTAMILRVRGWREDARALCERACGRAVTEPRAHRTAG